MNFSGEIDDRKESEEEKKYFKTNVLVPNKRACVDGATVAATPYLQLSWLFRLFSSGRTGGVLHGNNFTGSPHKIPLMSY